MQPYTACLSPQDASQLLVLSLVFLLCCTALEGVQGSSCVETSLQSVALCSGDPVPTISFQRRAKLSAWQGSLLIYFDNRNFILIIYGWLQSLVAVT